MNRQGFCSRRWIKVALVLIVIICVVPTTTTRCQQISDPLPENNNHHIRNLAVLTDSTKHSFLKNLQNDFTYILTQQDFYEIIGGLGLAPYIFKSQFDNESPELTEHWALSKFADNFFELGEGLGNPIYHMAASALILSFHGKKQNSSLKSFGSDLLRAQIFNGLITISMKGLINRKRPDGTPYSYPSGHTSTAFASAGVIYHHFGYKIGIPAFITASYVGLSRLQENKHYVTDIVAGAIIGTYVSFKIVRRSKSEKGIGVKPALILGSPAIEFAMRF